MAAQSGSKCVLSRQTRHKITIVCKQTSAWQGDDIATAVLKMIDVIQFNCMNYPEEPLQEVVWVSKG